jgi:hypothetical protein
MEKAMLLLVYRIRQAGDFRVIGLCGGSGSVYLLAHDEGGAVWVYLGLQVGGVGERFA